MSALHGIIMTSGTEGALSCIWGSSPSDVFAVGHHGIILRYDGSTWKEIMNSDTLGSLDNLKGSLYTKFIGSLRGVWGSSPTDVYVVGDSLLSGGTVLHYDGTAWSRVVRQGWVMLYGVWGSSHSDVFVVGSSAFLGAAILHFDGDQWKKVKESGREIHPMGIWGVSSSDVFVVGSAVIEDGERVGFILHYDGTTWDWMQSDTDSRLYSVWGNSASDFFAVGENGTILHYADMHWSEVPLLFV